MSKRAVCLLFILLLIAPVYAQENKDLEDSFLEAEYFLMNESYSDALTYYLQLYEKLPDNANLAYCIGVCYLNIPGEKNLSIEYLENASKNMSVKHKEGTLLQTAAPYDALFELGKAYRINYRFDKAKETFITYLETLLPDDHENIDFVKNEIKVCDMAKDMIAKPVAFSEENVGELFNDCLLYTSPSTR